jgi:hypothetical protein
MTIQNGRRKCHRPYQQDYDDFICQNYDVFEPNCRNFSVFWPPLMAYDHLVRNRHKSMTILFVVTTKRS